MTIRRFVLLLLLLFVSLGFHHQSKAQDQPQQGPDETQPAATEWEGIPLEAEDCNGVFISYDLLGRRKEFPKLKNATAQSWAFNATAKLLNTGTQVVKNWKLYVGFQHEEILVSASGAHLFEGEDFPVHVGKNGTYLVGAALPDLQTAINTAQDLNQIQAILNLAGTQFGVKPPALPMPKTIKLVIDGYACPQPTVKQSSMYACCKRDAKSKADTKKKYQARQKGDLSIMYDVLQVYPNNYFAQVTMENRNPLGRLDRWNLTWEWTRGEFIFSMKGAFTRHIDASPCIYGPAGEYYKDFDFSKVINCQKNPVISDLPPDKVDDPDFGKIPFCCRNGSLLSPLMDPNQAKSVFTMQVFKIPPDSSSRTSIYPPQRWRVSGILNPDYKCYAPMQVEPSRTPDARGIEATVMALASWQIVCNITKPTNRHTRCCVSFSAFYNESAVPCNTCACGCHPRPPSAKKCNRFGRAMLLPWDALLVPFRNRTVKALAWARLKHFPIPDTLPCPDNCGVSINWHIVSDYKGGWTTRMTIFNWETFSFPYWFTVLQFKNSSFAAGVEDVYSFNATILPRLNHTIFMQGMPGLTHLAPLENRTNLKVPGKQQSTFAFNKKSAPQMRIAKGDGFPSKLYFNGEECSIPTQFPLHNASANHHTLLVHVLYHILLVLVLHFTIDNNLIFH